MSSKVESQPTAKTVYGLADDDIWMRTEAAHDETYGILTTGPHAHDHLGTI